MRVITFSRFFPAHHPKKGQPTYLVEKVLNSFLMTGCSMFTKDTPVDFLKSLSKDFFLPKKHTIRAGKRWKTGDWFSPRAWSGKPYSSPQIAIAPDMQLVRVVDIEIQHTEGFGLIIKLNGAQVGAEILASIGENDGLQYPDFVNWFNKLPFSGQILIWDDSKLPY